MYIHKYTLIFCPKIQQLRLFLQACSHAYTTYMQKKLVTKQAHQSWVWVFEHRAEISKVPKVIIYCIGNNHTFYNLLYRKQSHFLQLATSDLLDILTHYLSHAIGQVLTLIPVFKCSKQYQISSQSEASQQARNIKVQP